VVYELQSGFGVLEFAAPELCRDDPEGNRRCSLKSSGVSENCPCISDPRLFEILSELLAEGWMKAARNLQVQKPGPLEFIAGKSQIANPARVGNVFSTHPMPEIAGKPLEGEAGV
jgi:hypothetical protein